MVHAPAVDRRVHGLLRPSGGPGGRLPREGRRHHGRLGRQGTEALRAGLVEDGQHDGGLRPSAATPSVTTRWPSGSAARSWQAPGAPRPRAPPVPERRVRTGRHPARPSTGPTRPAPTPTTRSSATWPSSARTTRRRWPRSSAAHGSSSKLGETAEGVFKYRRAITGFRDLGDDERAEAGDHQPRAAPAGTGRPGGRTRGLSRTGRRPGPAGSDPTTPPRWRRSGTMALTLARLGRLREAKVVAQNLVDGTSWSTGPTRVDGRRPPAARPDRRVAAGRLRRPTASEPEAVQGVPRVCCQRFSTRTKSSR